MKVGTKVMVVSNIFKGNDSERKEKNSGHICLFHSILSSLGCHGTFVGAASTSFS